MRIKSKRIRVIEMSKEEMDKFIACIEAARTGQTVHYGEERMSDGSYLGVSLCSEGEQAANQQAEREAGYERERKAHEARVKRNDRDGEPSYKY